MYPNISLVTETTKMAEYILAEYSGQKYLSVKTVFGESLASGRSILLIAHII